MIDRKQQKNKKLINRIKFNRCEREIDRETKVFT